MRHRLYCGRLLVEKRREGDGDEWLAVNAHIEGQGRHRTRQTSDSSHIARGAASLRTATPLDTNSSATRFAKSLIDPAEGLTTVVGVGNQVTDPTPRVFLALVASQPTGWDTPRCRIPTCSLGGPVDVVGSLCCSSTEVLSNGNNVPMHDS